MTGHAFINGHILGANGWLADHALLVDGGRIRGIAPQSTLDAHLPATDVGGCRIVPGFIDLQVNGGGGILFNDAPDVDAVAAIAAAHHRYGTTALLPTLISDDLPTIEAGIRAVDAAIARGVPGIVGIHIEGPFVNPARRGIHDAAKIRALDMDGIDIVASLQSGVTLVTLAPEECGLDQIAALSARGVILAAGHSEADFATATIAFDHGVTGVTHLFNAMRQIAPREPGLVGAALAHANTWCCIIVDGKHVHPANFRIAIAAKGGIDHFILVTDAMPTVGSDDKSFYLGGKQMRVIDGVCQADDGTLAGSDLDMAGAVRGAVDMLGLTLDQAVQMASINPARFMRLDGTRGSLRVGKAADFVLLDDACQVAATYIAGKPVYRR
ncbi:MAG: N-acetylglucosamine-6-phosphate deacetylase [Sphingomonadaceae bacterium]|nr:N-acetylglucosamine-6-phosphate deacetylase [Sphingomonadaceae bacterium]